MIPRTPISKKLQKHFTNTTNIPYQTFKLQDLTEVDTVEARREFAEGRIELAAIGTIADLMPLTGTNRVLAALGLEELAKTRRVGLQRLFELAGIKPEQGLSVYEVGFLIGPRLNAPGRLADALESLRLLCTRDADRARKLATTLNDLNEERQYLLARVSREAQQMAAERNGRQAFVLANPDWPAGVCGLAAGKVVEQMYRPTVVMEDQGEYSRGSARSIRGFDITAALTSIADLLVSFGGHAMAAGFVAKTELLPEIENRLSTLVEAQLSEDQLQPRLMIDAEVELSEMDDDLYQFIRQLEPCGMGNPQPVFVARGVEVVGCKAMGKEAKHLKLILCSQLPIVGGAENRERRIKNSTGLEAVAFGFGARGEELMGQRIDVAFNLDENVWNGKRSLQLKVRDMRALPQ
jgi:single-stranded-DNA-specific exonuclease